MPRLLPLVVPLLALAACGGHDRSSSVSVNVNDNGVAVSTGNDQEVSIDTPLFQGKLKLPKMSINADNFDLNGVHLPPGSAIAGMNMSTSTDNGEKNAQVRVRFTSPGAPAATRDWFAERLPKAGFDIHATPTGLAGTTDEHKPFAIDLKQAEGDRTGGEIRIGA